MAVFGELIKKHRLAAGVSLREFCATHGLDVGNHSKLERGQLPVPKSDSRIELYAQALGVVEGSDDWMELFDAAASEAGRIPRDLLEDAELVAKLPVLFRTLRSEQQARIDLDDLAERIRRS